MSLDLTHCHVLILQWRITLHTIVHYQTATLYSLAVEGLNREEIGIEEIFVPNEAESNGQ